MDKNPEITLVDSGHYAFRGCNKGGATVLSSGQKAKKLKKMPITSQKLVEPLKDLVQYGNMYIVRSLELQITVDHVLILAKKMRTSDQQSQVDHWTLQISLKAFTSMVGIGIPRHNLHQCFFYDFLFFAQVAPLKQILKPIHPDIG
jgi:hypothetical protein